MSVSKSRKRKTPEASDRPGCLTAESGVLTGLPDRPSASLVVRNTGDRPIQVGSHFHFFEANKALEFDRAAAWGTRLCIPSGTAVRFEPGMSREVEIVAMGGDRVVHGCNGLCNGGLDEPGRREAAFAAARALGFKGAPPAGRS
jgi:urease beta subunit